MSVALKEIWLALLNLHPSLKQRKHLQHHFLCNQGIHATCNANTDWHIKYEIMLWLSDIARFKFNKLSQPPYTMFSHSTSTI